MAIQLEMDELKGCITYFRWLFEQITRPIDKETGEFAPEKPKKSSETGVFGSLNSIFGKKFSSKGAKKEDSGNKLGSKTTQSKDILGNDSAQVNSLFGSKTTQSKDILGSKGAVSPSGSSELGDFSVSSRQLELCRWLFSVDFWSDLVEDGTQAANAMEMRRRYAEKMGSKLGKTDREIDRIWKSVHGKCSVFEFFVYISNRLDDITNEEEEPGSTIWRFFEIILGNLGLSKGSKIEDWQPILDKFLGRFYDQDGSNGGLFPLKTWSNTGQKDQRTVPIWYQMNNWINENLDEDGCFLWKNWPKFG